MILSANSRLFMALKYQKLNTVYSHYLPYYVLYGLCRLLVDTIVAPRRAARTGSCQLRVTILSLADRSMTLFHVCFLFKDRIFNL